MLGGAMVARLASSSTGLRAMMLAACSCAPGPPPAWAATQHQLARHIFGFGFGGSRGEEQLPDTPRIPARPATRRYAGQEWQDEYSWLEGGSTPEVQQVLQHERRYAERWLQRCQPLADQLHREMLAELPAAKVSVPERVGAHEYFVEQLPGRPHPCYMRRPVPPAGAAQVPLPRGPSSSPSLGDAAGDVVVLDLNELAAVHGEHVQVGQMKLSLCGQRVAFTLDAGTGEESFQAFVRDLPTGRLRHLGSLGGVASLEWAADGRTLLATQPNELGRPWRVVACDVGSLASSSAAPGEARHSSSSSRRGGRWGGGGSGSRHGAAAVVPTPTWAVFEESDERFFVELGRTKDWSFLTINCNSKASSEVHLLPTSLPPGRQWWGPHAATSAAAVPADRGGGPPSRGPLLLEPRLVQARQAGLEYFVEHNCGQLYILGNALGADNYAVFRVPAAAPCLGQEQWQVVVPEVEGVAIEDMDMSRRWLVLYLRVQGRQQVAALPLQGGLPAGGGAAAAAAAAAAEEGLEAVPVPAPAATAAAQAAPGAEPAAAAAAAGAGLEPVPGLAAPPGLCVAPLPGWALSVVAGANADFVSPWLRLMLSSPVQPEATCDWRLGSQQLVWHESSSTGGGSGLADGAKAAAMVGQRGQQQEQQQQQAADGGKQAAVPAAPAELSCHQLWATSRDGTAVPLTVAHAGPPPAQEAGSSSSSIRSIRSSSHHSCDDSADSSTPCLAYPRPCLLVVYGAYGHCLPTEFLAERVPLLRRGWVLALAHVRGGGELGRRWHAAGRGCSKGNSVADLEACLEHLVGAGYTCPGLVALEAHSAGGLTAGALLNRRPADVGAALLEAPFVDVLSAMCQPELPLTVHEYEEWGDPRQALHFQQIQELCPYQNVRPGTAYPPTLLTCSQQDLRVPFWGPLKHAARLRASSAATAAAAAAATAAAAAAAAAAASDGQQRPILLLPDEQAGHFVHERDLYETKARQYAFLARALERRL